MERKPQSGNEERSRSGKFTDVKESLLPLFDEGGSSRRWREMFGLERPRPRSRGGGTTLTDREER